MAELDIETARRAITTILESLLFTIKASAKELEKHYSSEYIAKSFNFLFETFADITTGKYGYQGEYIQSEVKRLIEKSNEKTDVKHFKEVVSHILGDERFN